MTRYYIRFGSMYLTVFLVWYVMAERGPYEWLVGITIWAALSFIGLLVGVFVATVAPNTPSAVRSRVSQIRERNRAGQ